MNPYAFVLTCEMAIGSVVLAVPIGCAVAFAMHAVGRDSRPSRFVWLMLLAACALPLYLHAAGWEAAAGKFGLFRWTRVGAVGGPLAGLTAAIWVHGLSGAAWVAIATDLGLSRLPRGLIDLARLDASSPWAWLRILAPSIRPWIALGAWWVATLAATEMTVVDLYGVRTLADEFYLLYASQPNSWAILRTLLPAIVLGVGLAFALRRVAGGIAAAGWDSVDSRPSPLTFGFAPSGPSARSWLAAVVAISGAMLILALPLISLIAAAGQAVTVSSASPGESRLVRTWRAEEALRTIVDAWSSFVPEYRWSAVLAGSSGLLATGIAAWLVLVRGQARPQVRSAGQTSATPGVYPTLTDLVIFVGVLIPGPLIGLGVVWLFRRDLPGFDFLYRQTLMPTLIALLPRSLAAAYVTLRVAALRLDPAVSDLARIDFASRWRRLWLVDRSRLAMPLLAAIAIAALAALGDVPATLPVLPAGVSTVGTRLFELLHSGARRQEAGLALGLIAIFLILAASVALGRRFLHRRAHGAEDGRLN